MKTNLIVILLLAFASCAQTSEKKEAAAEKMKEPEKIEGWKMLDEATYSIQYPSDWEANKTGQMGTTFGLFSPIESESDDFRENVNLLVQDLSGRDFDLDSYVDFSEKQIKEMLGVLSLTENKRLKNSNGDYQKFVYKADQMKYHLVFEQYCWVINDRAYVLTFTSEEDQYKRYQKVGEKILNSFVLK
ncbi:MAG: hypothetical protein ACO1N0_10510 [Fluviicola sp.]